MEIASVLETVDGSNIGVSDTKETPFRLWGKFAGGFRWDIADEKSACTDGSWANFCGRNRNPGNLDNLNGQTAPNRRAAMAEHAAGGRTRSPAGLLRSARDLHFDIPTF